MTDGRTIYALSKVHYLLDNLLYIASIGVLSIFTFYTYDTVLTSIKRGTFHVLIPFLAIAIAIVYVLLTHRGVVKQYRGKKLGDENFPSIHIDSRGKFVEVVHPNKYGYVQFQDVTKVGVLNLLITCIVLVESENPDDTFYIMLSKENALHFRKKLREEAYFAKRYHTQNNHSNIKHTEQQFRKYG